MPQPERARRDRRGHPRLPVVLTGTGGPPVAETAEELYEEAPCGYITADADGRILRVNRTFLRWTGHEAAHLVGRRLVDLLTAGGRMYHETHFAPLLAMQDAVSGVALDVRRADGDTLPVIVNATLRRDAGGAPAFVRITLVDATERLRYVREIQAARRAEIAARERVEHLQRITSALAATVDPDRVAEVLAAGIRDALPGAEVAVAVAPAADRAPPEEVSPAPGEVRLVVPMTLGDRTVGVVTVRRPGGDPPGDEDRVLIAGAAAQGAIGLERAWLFRRERMVAYELQRDMLVSEPVTDPCCTVTTHYQPGVAGLRVGGDWHDAFAVPGGLVGVGVGDVVGRGIGAARAMGQLRSAVRALAASGMPPATVLEQMDAFVMGVPGARVTTVVLAVLDPADGCVRFSCAGHPPPLLIPAVGPPTLLWDARSRPLGVTTEAVSRPEARIRLAPGDALLLYTDGVVERRDASIDTGLADLVSAVAGRGSRPPIDAVRAALLGGSPDDDACLLCLTFSGAG